MQVHSDSKPYDDINITPMLDLAYVLLIIFHRDDDGDRAGHEGQFAQGIRGAIARAADDQGDHRRQ